MTFDFKFCDQQMSVLSILTFCCVVLVNRALDNGAQLQLFEPSQLAHALIIATQYLPFLKDSHGYKPSWISHQLLSSESISPTRCLMQKPLESRQRAPGKTKIILPRSNVGNLVALLVPFPVWIIHLLACCLCLPVCVMVCRWQLKLSACLRNLRLIPACLSSSLSWRLLPYMLFYWRVECGEVQGERCEMCGCVTPTGHVWRGSVSSIWAFQPVSRQKCLRLLHCLTRTVSLSLSPHVSDLRVWARGAPGFFVSAPMPLVGLTHVTGSVSTLGHLSTRLGYICVCVCVCISRGRWSINSHHSCHSSKPTWISVSLHLLKSLLHCKMLWWNTLINFLLFAYLFANLFIQ